jgi:multiple sugar transport system substrate-binding protein
MKKINKAVLCILSAVLTAPLMAGCGSDATSNSAAASTAAAAVSSEESEATASSAAVSEVASDSASASTETPNTEWSGTLKLYGPGLFTSVGEDGTTDIVTGVTKPGYSVVVDRWKELYPNVDLDIETIPWDNWKAACQTAALSGDVDIILHGSSIVPICEPLTDYLEKDSYIYDEVGMMAMRKNSDLAPLSDYIPYGLTITVAPVMVVIDKEIFEDYGVDLPDYTTWTLDDMLSLAQKLTGTDPVTGKQTYGMSMIEAASANKDYIWASRAMDNEIIDWGDTLGTTKVNFKSDKTAKVLNYLTDMEKCASPDYLEGLDINDLYTADNNVAMCIVESAYGSYNDIKVNGRENKYMLACLPTIEDGEFKGITSSHMGDWNMAIAKNSKQKDLAWEFLKFMVTDDVVQQWILDTYSIPSNKEACAKLTDYMPAEYSEPILHIVQTAPIKFSASSNNCYDSSNFGSFANDLTTVINEMFQGNMDADEAMDYVQKNLDDYLSTLD